MYICMQLFLINLVLFSVQLIQAQYDTRSPKYYVIQHEFTQKYYVVDAMNLKFEAQSVNHNNDQFKYYYGALKTHSRYSINGTASFIEINNKTDIQLNGHHYLVVTSNNKGVPNLSLGNSLEINSIYEEQMKDKLHALQNIKYKVTPLNLGIIFKNKKDRFIIEQQTGLDFQNRPSFFIRGVFYIK